MSIEERYSYHLGLDRSTDYNNLALYLKSFGYEDGPFEAYPKHWNLEHLSVLPSFQRRAIGQRMVKAAQFIATKDNVPVILTASKSGIGLYEKCGFEKVGIIDVGPIPSPAMVWLP
jgi:ribosomal protein S18 acetylase RimI-like enzyme